MYAPMWRNVLVPYHTNLPITAQSGVNANQGAESVLSWLLSVLIMNEMQTGDPPQT